MMLSGKSISYVVYEYTLPSIVGALRKVKSKIEALIGLVFCGFWGIYEHAHEVECEAVKEVANILVTRDNLL